MIYFKACAETDPSKLGSAIAHNIRHSDIEIACAGSQAIGATIKGLIIAKKYTQNEPFTLNFDFFSIQERTEEGAVFTVIQAKVSKTDKTIGGSKYD